MIMMSYTLDFKILEKKGKTTTPMIPHSSVWHHQNNDKKSVWGKYMHPLAVKMTYCAFNFYNECTKALNHYYNICRKLKACWYNFMGI